MRNLERKGNINVVGREHKSLAKSIPHVILTQPSSTMCRPNECDMKMKNHHLDPCSLFHASPHSHWRPWPWPLSHTIFFFSELRDVSLATIWFQFVPHKQKGCSIFIPSSMKWEMSRWMHQVTFLATSYLYQTGLHLPSQWMHQRWLGLINQQ